MAWLEGQRWEKKHCNSSNTNYLWSVGGQSTWPVALEGPIQQAPLWFAEVANLSNLRAACTSHPLRHSDLSASFAVPSRRARCYHWRSRIFSFQANPRPSCLNLRKRSITPSFIFLHFQFLWFTFPSFVDMNSCTNTASLWFQSKSKSNSTSHTWQAFARAWVSFERNEVLVKLNY